MTVKAFAVSVSCQMKLDNGNILPTQSNIPDLDGKTGQFECVGPSADNQGPVKIDDTFYFRYTDRIPYRQFGATCCAWAHQGEEIEEQTLKHAV